MYKKVRFIIKETIDERVDILLTVLTEGYANDDIFMLEDLAEGYSLEFSVNRCDLADLRHDMNVLIKAGYHVREAGLN